jgi:hypothetical protein
MRRYATKTLSLTQSLIRISSVSHQRIIPAILHPHCLHTSPPSLKRHTEGKTRRREGKEAKKQDLEAELESTEEWVDTHNPSYADTTRGKRSMLIEETDPFEMDVLTEKLKEALDRLRKEASIIKQGRSDPEAIRGLYVDLPKELGGRLPFLDIATVGPKPGDARSLQITVFDVQVPPYEIRIYDSIQNIFFERLHRLTRILTHNLHRKMKCN